MWLSGGGGFRLVLGRRCPRRDEKAWRLALDRIVEVQSAPLGLGGVPALRLPLTGGH